MEREPKTLNSNRTHDDRFEKRHVEEQLQTLKESTDPIKRFERLMGSMSGIQERVPALRHMDQKQAGQLMVLFGLLVFAHTLNQKNQRSHRKRDDAEAERFKAEADKYRAEAEVLRKAMTANTKYQPGERLQGMSTPGVERDGIETGNDRRLFLEPRMAAKLQTAVQIASGKLLREEGGVSERDSRKYARGLQVYVDSEGNLVVEIPDNFRKRVRELHAQGKKTSLVEFIECPFEPIEIGKNLTLRVEFPADDTTAQRRFQRLIDTLGLDVRR